MSPTPDEIRAELAVIKDLVIELRVSDAEKSIILRGIRDDLNVHILRTDRLEGWTQRMNGIWLAIAGLALILGAVAKLMGKI
jgi:hypothetical protein